MKNECGTRRIIGRRGERTVSQQGQVDRSTGIKK